MKSSVVSLLEQSRYSWSNYVFQLVASNQGHRSKMTLMTSGVTFCPLVARGHPLADPCGGHKLKHVSQLETSRPDLKVRPKLLKDVIEEAFTTHPSVNGGREDIF